MEAKKLEIIKNLETYGIVNYYYPGDKRDRFAKHRGGKYFNLWTAIGGANVTLSRRIRISQNTYEFDVDYIEKSNFRNGFSNKGKGHNWCLTFYGRTFINNKVTTSEVKFYYRNLPKKWLPEWTETLSKLGK